MEQYIPMVETGGLMFAVKVVRLFPPNEAQEPNVKEVEG